MHVAAGGVLRRPHALGAPVGDGVERPEKLAALRVERLDEPTDSVLAAVGADQHLPLDDAGSHRLAVALVGIGDVARPDHFSALAVERDELRVERAEEHLVPGDRHAPVVRPAAEGRRGTHRVLVVPELLTGGGIDGVDVVIRSGEEHDAVHDDGRGFHRLHHRSLEHEGGAKFPDVARIDLSSLGIAGLRVILVRVDPVLLVVQRGIERLL